MERLDKMEFKRTTLPLIDKNLLCHTVNLLLILETIGAQEYFLLGLIIIWMLRKKKGIDQKPQDKKEVVACKKNRIQG